MVNNWQLGKHTPINHWTWHFDCHTKLSPIIMFLYKPQTIIIKKPLGKRYTRNFTPWIQRQLIYIWDISGVIWLAH